MKLYNKYRPTIRTFIVKIEAAVLSYIVRRSTLPGVTNQDTIIRYYRIVNKVAIDTIGHDGDHRVFLEKCFNRSLNEDSL